MVEYVNKCNGIHAVLLAQRESDAGLVRNLTLQPDHLLLAKAHQAPVLAHLVLLLLWSQGGEGVIPALLFRGCWAQLFMLC